MPLPPARPAVTYPLVAALCLFATAAQAQVNAAGSYPSKPVRLIVPFAPGGGNDLIGRLVAQKLTESLGQQVIVDNRPGAGGSIGSDLVAKAIADGYTMLMGHTGTLAINVSLYEKIPYNPVRDFAAVSLVASSPLVLVVHPSLPAKSVKEFIALAKTRDNLNYSSGGAGTGAHLSGELFKLLAGIKMTHVPYKGTSPGLTALLGGEVQAMFSVLPSALPQVKSGKLRALAVTGSRRSKVAPDLPTVEEGGLKGYESSLRYGLVLPAGTPRDIVIKLNREIARIVQSPDIAARLAGDGAEPLHSTPEEFARVIRSEIEKWAKVIKASGARAD